jgi:phage shock protein A
MNDQDETKATADRPDPDNNLGRGAPQDREERIRQRAHEIWEREGRPEGHAESHWERAAQDLDREDAEIRHKDAVADQPAGVKPERAPKHEKPDATKT